MEDKSLLGRVFDNKVIWQPLYQHPPTSLEAIGEDRLATHAKSELSRVVMELEGARHEGIVVYSASSAKMLINWSDGAWARVYLGHGRAQERCGARIPEGGKRPHVSPSWEENWHVLNLLDLIRSEEDGAVRSAARRSVWKQQLFLHGLSQASAQRQWR